MENVKSTFFPLTNKEKMTLYKENVYKLEDSGFECYFKQKNDKLILKKIILFIFLKGKKDEKIIDNYVNLIEALSMT